MTIGQLAASTGLRASALRYYEKVGLLKPVARSNGRRVYTSSAASELVVIRFAKQNGFALPEIRQLLRGFPAGTPPSTRWQKLARRKIGELETAIARANAMRKLLELTLRCRCQSLEQCAKGLEKYLSISKGRKNRARAFL